MVRSWITVLLLPFGIAILANGARPAARDTYGSTPGTLEDSSPRSRTGFPGVRDESLRARLDRLADRRAAEQHVGKRMTWEPWLGPTGEQLAGIVDHRMLTMPQLRRRVELLIQNLPPIPEGVLAQSGEGNFNSEVLAEDRRVMIESRVLADWIETTALAVYAEKIGIGVSDAEVDAALLRLTSGAGGAGALEGWDRVRLIGFQESELRQEVRDALLLEKVVRRGIHELVNEDEMRRIYASYPKTLLFQPTRVRAWQLFYPITRYLDKREKNRVTDTMNAWRKKLNRADTPEELAAMQRELGGAEKLVKYEQSRIKLEEGGAMPGMLPGAFDQPILIDLGWIAAGDLMPDETHRQLFTLKAGQTSKVFESRTKDRDLGFNAVKVVERVEGEKGSYADAKPYLENMLADKLRPMVYEAARTQLKIYSSGSGLKKWRELGPAPPPDQAGAALLRTQEPDLSGLRQDMEREKENPLLIAPRVEDVLMQNMAIRARENDQ